MDNIFITSTVSLRTRGPLSFSFNDYTCYSNDRFGRYPCAYSSQSSVRTCCNCLSNSAYKLPLTANCNCYLYGSRQSNLIQWVPRKKLTFSSFDRSYYARLPVCDVDRSCYCDTVCGIRDRNVGGRRAGLRKCRVSDESSKRRSFGGVDEAEVLLSLLADDLDEECYDVSEEDQRVNKIVVVQRKGNGETSNWCKTKTKRVDLGILTSESKFDHKSVVLRSKKEDKRKIEERIRREKDREDQRRKEIIKTQRKEEEREALLRRNNRANEEEKENLLRKENWKVKAVEDEKNDWLRREEHKERMRREGSSCSSYYSLSSAGEYNSDGEIEGVGEGSGVELSIVHEKDSKRSDKIISEEVGKEEYGAGLRKKSTETGFYGGSSGIESDFRKKSEKKMTDVMIEVVKSAEKSYDDGKVESTSGMKFDEEKRRKCNEVVGEFQTGMKYKQFTEMPSNRDDEAVSYYGSQKLFSDREEKFAKEHSTMVDTRKASKTSKLQEIDDRKASVSQQLTETRLKKKEEEEYSTDIITSKYDIEKKQQSEKTQQSDQVTGLVDERGNSNRLMKKESSYISPMQPESRVTKQEESVNLAYGKYMEPKEQQFESHEESSSRTNVRTGTQKRTNESITIVDKTRSQTDVAPPSSQSEARGELGVSPTGGVKIEEVTDEKDGGPKNEGPEKPSEFISNQDSLRSADELQKSSAHYVDEFVEKVRHEISTSEIHEEKRTYESKVESKEHHSRHSSRCSKTKGPSDETWEINEPSVKEQSRTEVQDDDSKHENAILKRTGRSMWSIIGDIFLLKWSPRSESHSTRGKPGGISSNQSTSSEAWFSGHEAEEEAVSERKERNISQEPSSSTIEAYAKHGGVDTLSSSTVQESDPKSLTPLPAMRLRRSPIVKEASGATEASSSGSDPTEVKKDFKQRKLQRNEQIPKDRFDEWEEAYRVEAEQRKVDEMFMREALLEAKKAADNWEVPVGAVLVQGGKIIARGCNLVEELRDSTAHAEMICIREASSVLRTWRLSETTLYVTLEPCPMCAGAILQARIDTVVWGAPNKLLGADGSWIRLFPSGDGGNELEQTDKPPAPVHPFHPKMTIRRGVLSTECADAMQQFFQLRRRKKEKKPELPTPPSCLPVSHRPSKFFTKMHDAFSIMFCL